MEAADIAAVSPAEALAEALLVVAIRHRDRGTTGAKDLPFIFMHTFTHRQETPRGVSCPPSNKGSTGVFECGARFEFADLISCRQAAGTVLI